MGWGHEVSGEGGGGWMEGATYFDCEEQRQYDGAKVGSREGQSWCGEEVLSILDGAHQDSP